MGHRTLTVHDVRARRSSYIQPTNVASYRGSAMSAIPKTVLQETVEGGHHTEELLCHGRSTSMSRQACHYRHCCTLKPTEVNWSHYCSGICWSTQRRLSVKGLKLVGSLRKLMHRTLWQNDCRYLLACTCMMSKSIASPHFASSSRAASLSWMSFASLTSDWRRAAGGTRVCVARSYKQREWQKHNEYGPQFLTIKFLAIFQVLNFQVIGSLSSLTCSNLKHESKLITRIPSSAETRKFRSSAQNSMEDWALARRRTYGARGLPKQGSNRSIRWQGHRDNGDQDNSTTAHIVHQIDKCKC